MSTPELRTVPSSPTPECTLGPFSPLQLRLIMGTELFGSNAAWLLLGFIVIQTYTYYTRSAKDHPIFQALVYSTVLIAAAESAVEGFTTYFFLASVWGKPVYLESPSLVFTVLDDLQPLFDALPAIFVQFYFTWRIWTFCMAAGGKAVRIIVAGICAFVVLTSICAFISAIILTVRLIIGAKDTNPPSAIVLVWTVSTVVADMTITACMMVILYHAKASSCFGETRDRIARLLRLTIQTGFLTSILALPIAPLYFRLEQGVFALTFFLLGKSYVISLLANLNARTYHPPLNLTNATPHFSTIVFNHGQNRSRDGAGTAAGDSTFPSIQSIMRTVQDPIESSPLSTESMSRPDAEVQLPAGDLNRSKLSSR